MKAKSKEAKEPKKHGVTNQVVDPAMPSVWRKHSVSPVDDTSRPVGRFGSLRYRNTVYDWQDSTHKRDTPRRHVMVRDTEDSRHVEALLLRQRKSSEESNATCMITSCYEHPMHMDHYDCTNFYTTML